MATAGALVAAVGAHRREAGDHAAGELSRAGWRTPAGMSQSTWQQRVYALGAGGYRRYDESTSKELGDLADAVLGRWQGDLRRLHAEAHGDTRRAESLLEDFGGIGPTGAAIFLREVQAVWADMRSYADELTLRGAREAGLPDDIEELAGLVREDQLHLLFAACVRIARDPALLGDEP